MSEEEKKDIENLIKKLSYCELEYQQNGFLSVGKFNAIKQAIQVIERQQKEIGLLRELLYMIRQETRYNTISFENNYYRPIKNVTKQQIYESYNIIRTLVKGNYVLLDNKEAIDSIVEKE